MQELADEGFDGNSSISSNSSIYSIGPISSISFVSSGMEEESVGDLTVGDLKQLHPSGDKPLSQGTPRLNEGFILAEQPTQITMELEPLEEPAQRCRGGGRRRLRRLIIDQEIAIPYSQLKDQIRDYSDTLRTPYDDICCPAQFMGGTAKELLLRPSVAQRSTLAELVTRNMKIKPMEDEFEAAPEVEPTLEMPPQGNRAETQLVQDSTVPNVGLPNVVSPNHFSGQQNIKSIDFHPMGAMEGSAYATLSEKAISTAEGILPVQIDENEIRRNHNRKIIRRIASAIGHRQS